MEPSNKRRIVWQKAFYLQRFRLQILSTEKEMNKTKLAVQYFPCLVLVAIYPGCVLFYSSFSQPCHVFMCAMWASSDVCCRFLEHFFLGLLWLRRWGVGFPWEIGIGIGAWTTCIFVQTCYLAQFCWFLLFWWPLCVSYPVMHNSLWHRRLACTCRGSQLFRGFGKQFVWSLLSMILLG